MKVLFLHSKIVLICPWNFIHYENESLSILNVTQRKFATSTCRPHDDHDVLV